MASKPEGSSGTATPDFASEVQEKGRIGPKRVLFLTNSEHGQANVMLAAAHALLVNNPPGSVEVHFGSFNPIAKAVAEASDFALREAARASSKQVSLNGDTVHCAGKQLPPPIVFHEVQGIPFINCLLRPEFPTYDWLTLRPGFWNTPRLLKIFVEGMFHPWAGSEYVEIFESVKAIIDEVRPDLVVLDNAFSPGVTAVHHLGIRFILLTPNTIKDFAAGIQPWGAAFWKYPCVLSAIPFPIPWYLIPLNIYFTLVLMFYAIIDKKRPVLDAYVKRHTGADIIRMDRFMYDPPPYLKILVATKPELDFPVRVPRHIVPCGTIIRPTASVDEVDPELATWLSGGPTVYITLGTHKLVDRDLALEMAAALRQLLDRAREAGGGMERLQVLWKLRKKGEFRDEFDYSTEPGSQFYDILGRDIEDDVVRIVKWVNSEPIAVLETGHVACLVSHGGANSFSDGLTSGVPQVILPTWVDCYEFGSRAEMLGIGLWGNKTARPRWTAKELGPVLIETVLGPRAESMRQRAREIQQFCKTEGGGRNVAARIIMDEIA